MTLFETGDSLKLIMFYISLSFFERESTLAGVEDGGEGERES